jgi:hypothetical protein
LGGRYDALKESYPWWIDDYGLRIAGRDESTIEIRNPQAHGGFGHPDHATMGHRQAVEDQFTLDLGAATSVPAPASTRHLVQLPLTGQLVQWFYNGNMDPDGKRWSVDLTVAS